MNFKWIIVIICTIILHVRVYPVSNEQRSINSFSLGFQQEKFNIMLLEGIVDSLNGLNLSKKEIKLLEDKFTLYVGKIYGSMEMAEQLFENNPESFEDKYLNLFSMIKKEIISNREKS